MRPVVAGALVFVTSAAVLILEILAVRLFAPYVGVTIDSYTAIIGTVLAGIAGGTWLGGVAADRVDPRRLLGPLLVFGGGLAMATVPVARLLGDDLGGGDPGSIVALSVATFFLPAAVLSAVNPCVVKIRLSDLAVTGRVVGRLSALGTGGALVGTFLAGFVLVEAAPTSTSILAIGGSVTAVGAAGWLWSSPRRRVVAAVVAVVAAGGLAGGAVTASRCDAETTYHCARIIEDEARPGGRLLMLDTERHSYVDLDDPTYLEFRYARVFADVIAAAAPDGPLDVLHVGGGGFTMPRYLAAVRPGTANTVIEIDRGLVRLVRDRLGLDSVPGVEVRVGDARVLIEGVAVASADVVVGDAFSGLTVPWHLTTVEFVRSVQTVLRDGGLYVLNVIDYAPLRFARAEAATLGEVFDHVAVVALPAAVGGDGGGNIVLVASDRPIPSAAVTALIEARGGSEVVVTGGAADTFIGTARPLTDDHAPVDQWIAQARPR